ncbi:Uncharacterised protein [Bordetella pertussis]|nr:Uncharacterised protein [Bordetella pertussis]
MSPVRHRGTSEPARLGAVAQVRQRVGLAGRPGLVKELAHPVVAGL